MTAIRWGILSTADIGRKKVIPGIRGAARCSVVAIASREPGRAAAVAAELGIPRAYGSYEALLADPEVDAVYIPLPNHLHAEWTMAAARAGKHVLCEKPLAMNADEAADMVAVCAAEGVRLMEAFMYRHHPCWVAARELVTSGRIGRLMRVDSWFSYFNDDPANIRNIAEVGGGALFDIGCYTINVSRMLFGAEPRDGRRADRARSGDRRGHPHQRDPRVRRRHGDVHLFDPGRAGPARRRLRDRGPDPRSTSRSTSRPTGRREITVTAGGEPPVAPATEVIEFEPADPYTVEAELFAAAILDGLPTPTPPEDAVANMRVIDRVFAAASDAGGAS